MGGLDSFFKAFEQDQFWALIDTLSPYANLAKRHPNRPEPELQNTENIQPPPGFPLSDMLFKLRSDGRETFVLFENCAEHKRDTLDKVEYYTLYFYLNRYRPLRVFLLYVTPEHRKARRQFRPSKSPTSRSTTRSTN